MRKRGPGSLKARLSAARTARRTPRWVGGSLLVYTTPDHRRAVLVGVLATATVSVSVVDLLTVHDEDLTSTDFPTLPVAMAWATSHLGESGAWATFGLLQLLAGDHMVQIVEVAPCRFTVLGFWDPSRTGEAPACEDADTPDGPPPLLQRTLGTWLALDRAMVAAEGWSPKAGAEIGARPFPHLLRDRLVERAREARA